MNDRDRFEARVRSAAAAFVYPPTPNVAADVRRRLRRDVPRQSPKRSEVGPERLYRWRLAWVALMIIATLAGLLAVPQVRAGLLEVLQIGAVRLFLVPPTATPTPTGAPAITPQPTPTLLPSLLELAGETTLDDAREKMDFVVLLPAYPADLGLPDYVFAQNLDGPMLIMVWLDPDRPGQIRLSLHEFGSGTIAANKFRPTVVSTATMNGQSAIWTEGPYLMELKSGVWDIRRLIEGHVLIWVNENVTYRVETDLPLEEAINIAESLK